MLALDFIKKYIAPDGGGMLHQADLQAPMVENMPYTTINQNPMLFLSYLYRPYRLLAGSDHNLFIDARDRLMATTKLGTGRYIRRAGDPLRQSHDNLIGILWFNTKIGDIQNSKEIYNWAKWRLFNYNAHQKFRFEYRCQLQPSTILLLKLAAGVKPGWISTLWATGAFILTDHSSDRYLTSMLRLDIIEDRKEFLSKRKWKVLNWAMEMHKKRREFLARWHREYYRDDSTHPTILMYEMLGA